MNDTDPRLLLLHPDDNVLVLRAAIQLGETIRIEGVSIDFTRNISMGHKLARRNLKTGDKVIKYGAPIGSASRDIKIGDHVHLLNLKSDYTPTHSLDADAVDFSGSSKP